MGRWKFRISGRHLYHRIESCLNLPIMPGAKKNFEKQKFGLGSFMNESKWSYYIHQIHRQAFHVSMQLRFKNILLPIGFAFRTSESYDQNSKLDRREATRDNFSQSARQWLIHTPGMISAIEREANKQKKQRNKIFRNRTRPGMNFLIPFPFRIRSGRDFSIPFPFPNRSGTDFSIPFPFPVTFRN